jgi:AcrR family transcriptional regulator
VAHATNSTSKHPGQGRKAAYFARNRSAIVSATQELLGVKGWGATIDEVAAHAGVSVSTLYQHFATKDELFTTCVIEAWAEFESWAISRSAGIDDPLERLVMPMRLMFRTTTSHPTFAQMVGKNQGEFTALIPALTKNLGLAIRQLVKAKILMIDKADIRITNLKAVLMRIFVLQFENTTSNPKDADFALSVALPMIGIPEHVARQITSTTLP